MTEDVPSIWLETDSKLLIAGFYRQWNSEDSGKLIAEQTQRLSKFLEQVEQASKTGCDILLLGDWNLNYSQWHLSLIHI